MICADHCFRRLQATPAAASCSSAPTASNILPSSSPPVNTRYRFYRVWRTDCFPGDSSIRRSGCRRAKANHGAYQCGYRDDLQERCFRNCGARRARPMDVSSDTNSSSRWPPARRHRSSHPRTAKGFSRMSLTITSSALCPSCRRAPLVPPILIAHINLPRLQRAN